MADVIGLLKESVFAKPEHDQPWFEDQSSDLKPVTLSEWKTERVPLREPLARRLGEEQYKNWLSVSPDPETGWWKLKANHYVGGFTVDGLRVIVRPKIKPRNLFLMLEVGLPVDAWLPEAMEYAESQDPLSALISFFARTAETTLARGHYHSYRHQSEDLLTLRGRLDFSRQFRRGGQLVPMACSYDDFTADVAENRYLKAAMQRAIRVAGVPLIDRRRLMRLLVALEDVTDAPVDADDIDRITFTRLNEHYLQAMRLARLILANLTLQDRHGDTAASAFMLDMNDLFERFVTERLRRELAGRLEVKTKERRKLDTRGYVTIEPDLLFRQDGELVGVADIKYKLRDTDEPADIGPGDAGDSDGPDPEVTGAAVRATHADYYQLLAYTTALGLPSGTLIYCVDADTDNRGTTKRSQLPGFPIEVKHAHKRLDVVGIDLSGTPADIQQQITALADHLLASTHPIEASRT